MPLTLILLSISCLFALAFLGMGYFFAVKVIYPDIIPSQKTYEMEQNAGKFSEPEYQSWQKEDVWINSPYNYKLYAIYLPLNSSKKTVILCHGITYSLFGSVKYISLFRSTGFNVVLYDHRHHGRSGGSNTTFGYFEKHDLTAVIDWTLQRVGQDSIIGTMGESMGAAIALQHAAIDPRVRFVVSDCSFSDLPQLLELRAREDYHIPPFPLLNLASWISRILIGFNFGDVSPIHEISKTNAPILFVHGVHDTYIPPGMSVEMAKVNRPSLNRSYLAPGAGHAESISKNPQEYDQTVGDFLAEISLDEHPSRPAGEKT